MTDLEQMKAMLYRAGIPYAETVIPGDNLTALDIEGNPMSRKEAMQPNLGGYTGFFSSLMFAADGSLHAVWAWE